jgi:hypothetical protein
MTLRDDASRLSYRKVFLFNRRTKCPSIRTSLNTQQLRTFSQITNNLHKRFQCEILITIVLYGDVQIRYRRISCGLSGSHGGECTCTLCCPSVIPHRYRESSLEHFQGNVTIIQNTSREIRNYCLLFTFNIINVSLVAQSV